ncbi:MAG: Hpt domain-containing protein [Gemmataceae bacterium]
MTHANVGDVADNFCPEMDDAEMAGLVQEYLVRSENNVVAMRQALEGDDRLAIRTMAHFFRGSGGMFGFGGFSILGGKIEDAIKNGDSADQLVGFLNLLDAMVQRARKQFMPADPGNPASPSAG